MMEVVGAGESDVRRVVDDVREVFGIHVGISKRNGVSKIVVTGEPAGIRIVQQRLAEMGANPQLIPVNTPFHDPHFFAGAAGEFLTTLKAEGLTSRPADRGIALIANSTGQVVAPDADILEVLAAEIAAPVDLVTSAQTAYLLGGNTFIDVGIAAPSSAVSNTLANILGVLGGEIRPVQTTFVSGPDEMRKFLKETS